MYILYEKSAVKMWYIIIVTKDCFVGGKQTKKRKFLNSCIRNFYMKVGVPVLDALVLVESAGNMGGTVHGHNHNKTAIHINKFIQH